jgi:uncharacterized membrane protein YgcG
VIRRAPRALRHRQARRPLRRTLCHVGLAAAVALVTTAVAALMAANAVPTSRVSNTARPITANDLKPTECDGITLTRLVVRADGTAESDLILGSMGGNTLSGGGGNDCMVGGGGRDRYSGDDGDDVLLGGPGPDVLDGGPGVDACYGGPNNDSFANCEIAVQ